MKLFPRPSSFQRRAFTLVEILTALAITTIIVIALVSMFNASTKALQVANRQTDIWESARATFGILKREIGEVTAGGLPERVHLFSANDPAAFYELAIPNLPRPTPILRKDIYLLTRENDQWTANVFLLGRDRQSDPDSAVATLYHYRKSYPAVTAFDDNQLDIDVNLGVPPLKLPLPLAQARDALDKNLDDLADGRPPDGTVNAMAKGIVHLQLVAYAADGRAFTNSLELAALPDDHYNVRDTLWFQGDILPASLDLEMFVLEPDRIEEFRAQAGPIARQLYLEKHINSIQLFRTRIPIRRDLLARQ
jgi:hypothetical protein